ncbi:MAG: glycosyltransferase family 4 protein [Rhodomicrobium sp.]
MRLIFAIPCDLASLTGGYRYDRELMARLSEYRIGVIHCQMPGSFPHPTTDDLRAAVHAVNAAISPGDIVLMDGLAYGVFPEAAIRAMKAPIIALCHHPLGLETGLQQERSRALLNSERKALGLAARVVATSAFTARTLEQEFDVPAVRISVALPGTEAASRAQGSGGPPVLLAIGSITPRKAFNILIEALESISDIDWQLRIVGGAHHSPETAAALQELIESSGLSSRVKCLGELYGAALDDNFHRSDVFVSSSLYEGYGMALSEAMARGLPIVTSTGGAAAETVPDNAALKVPPGDVAALGEALRRIILDKALRDGLSEASWRAGQNLPSWGDTAGAVARVVKEVALASQ